VIKKLIILAIIVVIAVFIRNSPYSEYLTFSYLEENSDALLAYVSDNRYISIISYVFVYIVVAGLNLPGAAVMSLSGGFLFGAGFGTAFAVTGATLGACIGFLVSRYLLGDVLNTKYEKQLAKFNKELAVNGYLYMLTLRLIPIFPFFVINIVAGLTKLRLFTFFWTSFIGMLPGGFVYVYAGSRLSNIESPKDIFSPGMISAFILFGLLMLVPVVYKKVKGRV